VFWLSASDVGETAHRPTAPADRFRRTGSIEAMGARMAQFPLGKARRWLKRAYHAVLMLQTGGRGLRCVLPDGEEVRVLPEHRYLSWNPSEYAAFRSAVRPGIVALDVGANVGAYSLLLGQWTGPSGAVFAFEPAPAPFEGLVRHVHLNHLDDVVRPVRLAIGEASSNARLLVAGTAGESRLATPGDPLETTVTVPVVTIDEFCARERIEPGFIKIDVEGFELAALRGARETIRARRGALSLFVEMHPTLWPTLGLRHTDILEELRAQSLEPVPLVPSADIWATEGMCLRLVPR
jgi:FkbM family methyltransferase